MPAPVAEPRPLFSIVTVCRNAVRSIRRTIESVRQQQDVPGAVEHLVIDGVSTDGTVAALAEFPHLRVVSEPDGGIYDAMNKGAALARGEYIAILNADDWYEPETLARVALAFRESPEASVVHGDVRRWVGTAPLDIVKSRRPRRGQSGLFMSVNHPACFVKRDVFKRFGGFNLAFPMCADYDWIERVIRGGAVLRYVPHVLTNFAMGGVSSTRFIIRERYRVRRANGAGILPAAGWVARSCAVVLRNRWRGVGR
jgi:glycosyltransferase involved in cell wall biosynthesis